MKIDQVAAELRTKALDDDTLAQAVLLLAHRLSALDERLMNIDGVLTEIRNAIEQRS